jgi:hypothetical protein
VHVEVGGFEGNGMFDLEFVIRIMRSDIKALEDLPD